MAVLSLPLTGSLLRQNTEDLQRNLYFWTLLSLITVMLVASHGGYRTQPGNDARKQAGLPVNCFLATSIAMLALSVLLGHPHILLRRWTVADLLLTPLILCFERSLLTAKLAHAPPAQTASGTLVVCFDHYPRDLPRALYDLNISSNIAGVLYLSPWRELNETSNWPELSDPQSLLQTIKTKDIQDIVFIHHPELDAFAATRHQELLADLLAFPARIWIAFDVTQNLPAALKSNLPSCRIVPIVTDSLVSSLNGTKRIFDLVGGLALLFAASPLLLVLAVLVKASGPGPVIFRQIRTGAQGKQFTVLKFRTMTDDPAAAFAQARRNDPRVTTIGRLLRRTSLDELLQLINVIRGDMSLVGPRPHAPETQVEGISFENALRLYQLRHRVKPGITGLAQIRGQRGETNAIMMLEQRLASDLEYIRSWSLWLDISILIQTLPLIIFNKNAW